MALHLMRVIAGSAKGRRLQAPRGLDTRPMTSRAREALFSSIGDRVTETHVLDLYAGSGSLGIEALSRGAASATFVESARPALAALRANLEATGFDGKVVAGSVETVVGRLAGPFDLVFVDPPFELPSGEVADLLTKLVTAIAPGATVVVHRRAGDPEIAAPGFLEAVGDRRYGDSVLWRFGRTS